MSALALPQGERERAEAMQAEAENELLPMAVALEVRDAESYTLADDLLTEIARRKDSVAAMRKSATGPIYQAVRTIEAWFKPGSKALESAEATLKKKLAGYRKRIDAQEQAARERAAAKDHAGVVDAMNLAVTTSAPVEAGRSTGRKIWKVKSVSRAKIDPKYLIVDRAALDRLARSHRGPTPPVVAGVEFEADYQIGARRK